MINEVLILSQVTRNVLIVSWLIITAPFLLNKIDIL